MRRHAGLMVVCLVARLALPGSILAASAAVGEATQLRRPTSSLQTSCLPPRLGGDVLDRAGQRDLHPAPYLAAAALRPLAFRSAPHAPVRCQLDRLRRWQRRALRRTVDDPPA